MMVTIAFRKRVKMSRMAGWYQTEEAQEFRPLRNSPTTGRSLEEFGRAFASITGRQQFETNFRRRMHPKSTECTCLFLQKPNLFFLPLCQVSNTTTIQS